MYPDVFYEALELNIEDYDTYRVMADWYEEQGLYDIAKAIRWQLHEVYFPVTSTIDGKIIYYWINETKLDTGESRLPTNVYRHLLINVIGTATLSTTRINKTRYHSTLRKALEDLYQAYTKSRQRNVK